MSVFTKLQLPALLALLQIACIFGKKDGDDTDAVVSDDDDAVSLTSGQFEAAFGDKVCDETEDCDPTEQCSPAEWSNTLETDCDFDPEQGQDCLDRDWVCDESNPDHPYVQFPPSCLVAYVC